jgi:hypothetical protein
MGKIIVTDGQLFFRQCLVDDAQLRQGLGAAQTAEFSHVKVV